MLGVLRTLRNILTETRCPIWPEFKARIEPTPHGSLRVTSPRAGGGYEVTPDDADTLNLPDASARARLTTWIINERSAGVPWPKVTQNVIINAIAASPLPIEERADRLLRFIADRIHQSNISNRPRFKLQPRKRVSETNSVYPTRVGPGTHLALARTESIAFDDIRTLIEYLERCEWLQGEFGRIRDEDGRYTQSPIFHCRVTVEGYGHLKNLVPNADSSQAFVATWIDDSVSALFEKGIEPAINAARYDAYMVNKDPRLDKIDDAVREEIQRSRFLVADVTHGEKGPRGSVYYEIGIAHGIEIPVIFTWQDDLLNDDLTFDTRQHKHIPWRTNREHELIDDLRSVIIGRLGLGKRF